jgi:predicted acetyltransferase
MIQTKDSNLTFRPLTIDDAEQYNALLRYAFQVTEQELSESGWKDDEIKQSKFPVLVRADVLGCFCEEDLVSQFAVYPLDMNIYGVRYPVGFVTSVCTYPEYTGQGIMKKLMIRSLTRMRENHRSFALLYPYSIPLYRNLGWEIISNKMTYTIKDTQVPRKLKAPGYVRRVAWDDKDFKELHTKFASKTHGCLWRGKNISAGMRMIPSLRSTIPLMMCRTATWSI